MQIQLCVGSWRKVVIVVEKSKFYEKKVEYEWVLLICIYIYIYSRVVVVVLVSTNISSEIFKKIYKL